MLPGLEEDRDAISDACRQHGVARPSAFGSALRDDFRPGQSDVGFHVEGGPMAPFEFVEVFLDAARRASHRFHRWSRREDAVAVTVFDENAWAGIEAAGRRERRRAAGGW